MQQARARSDEMRVARRHIGINLEQMGGTMGDVVANMSMSLAGYMEDARGGVDKVFAWLYGSGNAEVAVVTTGSSRRPRPVPIISARHSPPLARC
jgi:hypothetical protein